MTTPEDRRAMIASGADGFLAADVYVVLVERDGVRGMMSTERDGRPFLPIVTDPSWITDDAVAERMTVVELLDTLPEGFGLILEFGGGAAEREISWSEVEPLRLRARAIIQATTSAAHLPADEIEARRRQLTESAESFLDAEAYVGIHDDGAVLSLVQASDQVTVIPVFADPADTTRYGVGARLVPVRHMLATMPAHWGIVVEQDHDEWRRVMLPEVVAALRRTAQGETDAVTGSHTAAVDAAREQALSGPVGFLESSLWVATSDEGQIIREVDEESGHVIISAFADDRDMFRRFDGPTPQRWSMQHLIEVLPEDYAISFDPGRPSHRMFDPAALVPLRDLCDPFPRNVEARVEFPAPGEHDALVRSMTAGAEQVPGRLRMWCVQVWKRSFTRPQVLFVVQARGEVVRAVGGVLQRLALGEDHAPVVVVSDVLATAPKEFRRLLRSAPPLVEKRR